RLVSGRVRARRLDEPAEQVQRPRVVDRIEHASLLIAGGVEHREERAYDLTTVASRERTLAIVVTGAGSGIGRATALLALERGHAVAAVDVDEQGLAELADAASRSERLVVSVADVVDPTAVAAAVAAAVERFGRLEALVAAAAIGPTGRIDEMDSTLWDRIVDVTLKGSAICCRAAIPHMRASGGGAIVLFG